MCSRVGNDVHIIARLHRLYDRHLWCLAFTLLRIKYRKMSLVCKNICDAARQNQALVADYNSAPAAISVATFKLPK